MPVDPVVQTDVLPEKRTRKMKYSSPEEKYEAHLEACRRYYQKIKPVKDESNPTLSSYSKEWRQKYYQDNKEKLKEYQKEYKKKLNRIRPID